MKNYRKHIDDFFREKLGNYSETPPADVWDTLDKRLDGLSATSAPHTSPYRWMWHFAIVSLLLILGASVLKKATDRSQNTGIAALSQPSPSQTGAIGSTGTSNHNMVSGTAVAAPGSSGQAASQAPVNAANSPNAGSPVAAILRVNTANINNAAQTAAIRTAAASKRHQSPSAGRNAPVSAPNNYNSSYASATSRKPGPAPEDEGGDGALNNTAANAAPGAQQPAIAAAGAQATGQKKAAAAPKATAATKPANDRQAVGFSHFEAGLKIGYEGSPEDGAAQKAVIAPYLQYNVSRKLAIMIQPAVKEALTTTRNIGNGEGYYSDNPENATVSENDVISTKTIGAQTVVTHTTSYAFSQPYDSIVKSHTTGGAYTEAELPILLKYNITKKVSVYGGVNLVYSKLMGVTEHTATKQVVGTLDTTIVTRNTSLQSPTVPGNIGVTLPGSNILGYSNPYPGTPGYQLRAGYMLGFTYAWNKRWLADALLEQAPAASDMKAGYNINTPLSATYFRLSIGYKITK